MYIMCVNTRTIGLVTLMRACRPAVSTRGLFDKACSPTMSTA